METDELILSLILFLASSPVIWLIALGPVLFTISLNKVRVAANGLKRKNRIAELPEVVQRLANIEQGDSEYSIMEFGIHFYTLVASMIGINIALWKLLHYRIVYAPALEIADWYVLRIYTIGIQVFVVGIVTLWLLLSGTLGAPSVVESFSKRRRAVFGDITLPPMNRILTARFICLGMAIYVAILTIFGLNVRVLP
ncbi:hypothetical protein [Roseovarius sp. 2305UL8-3]|uniref:hypothetical protein n=1 Tax=Roseovarius conchicola TaxID=3121636 RepID=UPI00352720A8